MPPVASQSSAPKSVFAALADAAMLLGVGAVSFGFWLAWRPLGFIVGGLALAALGMLYGRGIAEMRRRS